MKLMNDAAALETALGYVFFTAENVEPARVAPIQFRGIL
jgi:hypothetical protein